jgi:hypothetical protein
MEVNYMPCVKFGWGKQEICITYEGIAWNAQMKTWILEKWYGSVLLVGPSGSKIILLSVLKWNRDKICSLTLRVLYCDWEEVMLKGSAICLKKNLWK